MSILKNVLKKLFTKEKDSENSSNRENLQLFEKAEMCDLVLGQQYPIYGMVTNILNDNVHNFIVELNYSIKVRVLFSDEDSVENNLSKKEIILNKSFEAGVFIVEFTKLDYENIDSAEYPVEATCYSMIFGKSNADLDNIH